MYAEWKHSSLPILSPCGVNLSEFIRDTQQTVSSLTKGVYVLCPEKFDPLFGLLACGVWGMMSRMLYPLEIAYKPYVLIKTFVTTQNTKPLPL